MDEQDNQADQGNQDGEDERNKKLVAGVVAAAALVVAVVCGMIFGLGSCNADSVTEDQATKKAEAEDASQANGADEAETEGEISGTSTPSGSETSVQQAAPSTPSNNDSSNTGNNSSSGATAPSAPFGGNNNSSGTTTTQPTTPSEPQQPTHNWVEQTTQVWVSNMVWESHWVSTWHCDCGASFSSGADLDKHQESYMLQSNFEHMGHSVTEVDQGGYVDKGSYQTQGTGTYVCSTCGATK